jgi:UDP-N-acetylglucosamine--N-acetylmuramyl-(pentapeptide) pyrophosphoryl-undecaprenol N-acetylglucosamine transferase
MITVAFAGGGTGGHIYPGLAVIEKLHGYRVIWIGSKKGIDHSIVEGAGIEFFGITAGKLRRYFSLKTIPDAFRVAAGFFQARSILKKQKVNLLFSKGGFVSVPPCAAAASLGIPVFTHESDYSLGLATRLNLRCVRRTGGRVFVSYPETKEFLPEALQKMVTISGNPVRGAFYEANPEKGREFLGLGPQERILLVLGGSQGAREINLLVRQSLKELRRYYTVVHQCGQEQNFEMQKEPGYIPLPYIREEMPQVLAAAELVVGRSGAGTVWESAVLGKPMILIPLCGSGTRGDQVENARFFEKEGAALVLTGSDTTAEKLSAFINSLACDNEKRGLMAKASLKAGSPGGASIIVDAINNFLRSVQ